MPRVYYILDLAGDEEKQQGQGEEKQVKHLIKLLSLLSSGDPYVTDGLV